MKTIQFTRETIRMTGVAASIAVLLSLGACGSSGAVNKSTSTSASAKMATATTGAGSDLHTAVAARDMDMGSDNTNSTAKTSVASGNDITLPMPSVPSLPNTPEVKVAVPNQTVDATLIAQVVDKASNLITTTGDTVTDVGTGLGVTKVLWVSSRTRPRISAAWWRTWGRPCPRSATA